MHGAGEPSHFSVGQDVHAGPAMTKQGHDGHGSVKVLKCRAVVQDDDTKRTTLASVDKRVLATLGAGCSKDPSQGFRQLLHAALLGTSLPERKDGALEAGSVLVVGGMLTCEGTPMEEACEDRAATAVMQGCT